MKSLNWSYRIPFLKNIYLFRIILMGYVLSMILVTGIFLIIFLSRGDANRIYNFLFLMMIVGGIFLVLLALATWILLGNGYAVDYFIDDEGIKVQGKIAGAKAIRLLALAAGTMSGKRELTGTGMMVNDTDAFVFPWKDISYIKLDQINNRVIVKCSFWRQVALHYSEEMEAKMEETIDQYSSKI
jgi:hypothetical protein